MLLTTGTAEATQREVHMERRVTDWDSYVHYNPSNLLVRKLFLDAMFKGYQDLLRHALFVRPVSILELGAGTGYISRRISELLPTRRITLVDSNPKMLEVSKKTLEPTDCEKEFVHSDIFDLDLDRGYDVVHSAGVVEHFGSTRRAELLALHAAFTLEGGYCIVYAPTPTRAYRFWRGLAEALDLWPYHDEAPLTAGQLVREVQSTGLEVLSVNTFWNMFLTEAGLIARK